MTFWNRMFILLGPVNENVTSLEVMQLLSSLYAITQVGSTDNTRSKSFLYYAPR